MFRCLSILWFLSFEVLTGLWVNVAEHSLFGIGAFVPFLRGGGQGFSPVFKNARFLRRWKRAFLKVAYKRNQCLLFVANCP